MRVVIRPEMPRWRWPTRLQLPDNPEMRFRSAALALASLLTPCSFIALTLTCWKIAADLRWTASFFVGHGLFSHWQIWLVSSAVLLLWARALGKYGDENHI